MSSDELRILHLVRNEAKDLRSIFDGLGMAPPQMGTSWFFVLGQINNTIELNLVDVFVDNIKYSEPGSASLLRDEFEIICTVQKKKKRPAHRRLLFKASDYAIRLLNTFTVSLRQLCDLSAGLSMTVSPIFGLPTPRVVYPGNDFEIIVLMPFVADLKPVYDDHIKKIAIELNLGIKRADDLFSGLPSQL